MMTTITASHISKLGAKLSQLESKHQSIQERQDKIDNLALDTFVKMESLLAKMKACAQLQTSAQEQLDTQQHQERETTEEKGESDFRFCFFDKRERTALVFFLHFRPILGI